LFLAWITLHGKFCGTWTAGEGNRRSRKTVERQNKYLDKIGTRRIKKKHNEKKKQVKRRKESYRSNTKVRNEERIRKKEWNTYKENKGRKNMGEDLKKQTNMVTNKFSIIEREGTVAII
jgi:hypothetical protein